MITDMRTGEKLRNFKKIEKNDIVMGDRMYGTVPGISYLAEREAGFVLRIKTHNFNIYNGTISNNIGSGVSIAADNDRGVVRFSMLGGLISGNSGVGVVSIEGGSFTKTGGTITGTDFPGGGLAVSAWGVRMTNGAYTTGSEIIKRKTTTAGHSDSLSWSWDFFSSGNAFTPSWSGAWD